MLISYVGFVMRFQRSMDVMKTSMPIQTVRKYDNSVILVNRLQQKKKSLKFRDDQVACSRVISIIYYLPYNISSV